MNSQGSQLQGFRGPWTSLCYGKVMENGTKGMKCRPKTTTAFWILVLYCIICCIVFTCSIFFSH